MKQKKIIYFLSKSTAALVVLFCLLSNSCKRNKAQSNLEWQNESLRLTADICNKFRDCSANGVQDIPNELKTLLKEKLEETDCQKRFRDSAVYRGIGPSLEIIQALYRDCHKEILQRSCDSLKKKEIDRIQSCLSIQKIQKGEY